MHGDGQQSDFGLVLGFTEKLTAREELKWHKIIKKQLSGRLWITTKQKLVSAQVVDMLVQIGQRVTLLFWIKKQAKERFFVLNVNQMFIF